MKKSEFISIIGGFSLAILLVANVLRKTSRNTFDNIPFVSYILSVLIMAVGFYVIVAIREQHRFFVSDRRYLLLKKILGKRGVNLFYYLLGALLLGIGSVMLLRS